MPSPLTDTALEAIRSALAAGRKIEAIKLYRESTGAGLVEAKAFVERLDLDSSVSTTAPHSIDDDTARRIQTAIFAGQKIEAIKLHRTATGMGLRESKDFIEALEAELRRIEPGKFTAPPAKGCASMILCVLLAAGVVIAALA
jgi:ribosomal protein L7/L12